MVIRLTPALGEVRTRAREVTLYVQKPARALWAVHNTRTSRFVRQMELYSTVLLFGCASFVFRDNEPPKVGLTGTSLDSLPFGGRLDYPTAFSNDCETISEAMPSESTATK